jgi:hypothetical protein
VPVGIGQEETMSSRPPDRRPLLRPLFVILLCTGYVYVAFFVLLLHVPHDTAARLRAR